MNGTLRKTAKFVSCFFKNVLGNFMFRYLFLIKLLYFGWYCGIRCSHIIFHCEQTFSKSYYTETAGAEIVTLFRPKKMTFCKIKYISCLFIHLTSRY